MLQGESDSAPLRREKSDSTHAVVGMTEAIMTKREQLRVLGRDRGTRDVGICYES
jgi:UDP-glucose 4-epimerase